MRLEELGWGNHFEQSFAPYRDGSVPGRVAVQFRHAYHVYTERGEVVAEVTGRLRYLADSPAEFPVVGDWVALKLLESSRGLIHALLPRRTAFSRKAAGPETSEQVVASNIDTVFLVVGLDGNFNLRRIERYLSVAWSSGANPVVVLNKADICDWLDEALSQVRGVATGAPVLVVSAMTGMGLDALRGMVRVGETAVLLGSSGVGKSSIINRLVGENRLQVREVRESDSRGRHTTTHRELVILPNGGGLLIDTPGMRELQLWDVDEGVEESFKDIRDLERQCRFADCSHRQEPDCAVRAALQSGRLDQTRYDNYVKLQKETAYVARKQDIAAQLAERSRWKRIQRAQRNRAKTTW